MGHPVRCNIIPDLISGRYSEIMVCPQDNQPPVPMSDEPREAYLAFCRRLLKDLRALVDKEGVAEYEDLRAVFTERGVEHQIIKKRDYERLWYRHDNGLAKSQLLGSDCIRAHIERGILRVPDLSDSSGKKIIAPTTGQVTAAIIGAFLEPFFRTTQNKDALDITDEDFLGIYDQFRTGWVAKDPLRIATIPLLNFESETSLSVGDGLELAPFSAQDKNALFGSLFWYGTIVDLRDAGANYKLFGTFSDDTTKEVHFGTIMFETTTTVTAMRLLHGGEVGATMLMCRSTFAHDERMSGNRLNDLRPRGFAHHVYRLTAADVAPLLGLCGTLRRGLRNGCLKPLDVALRRFNLSYGRQSLEDRLIDLTIALESLVLFKVEDELSYRLSLRGAALLRDAKDPSETQATLKCLYDVRSKVVHEGMTLGNVDLRALKGYHPKINASVFIELTEDISREVIKAYIARLTAGKSLETVNKELEIEVLESLQRRDGVISAATS